MSYIFIFNLKFLINIIITPNFLYIKIYLFFFFLGKISSLNGKLFPYL